MELYEHVHVLGIHFRSMIKTLDDMAFLQRCRRHGFCEYWGTERVSRKALCLQADTLQELAVIVRRRVGVSSGLAFVPGEAIAEEATV